MNYKTEYNNKLKIGLEYQDFVAEQLYKIGLPIFNYASHKYQIEYGENKLGIEIKFDDKFKDTGNFWIEIKEKSNPNNSNYVNSGIYRKDNSWLYTIGNYQTIFIFPKLFLQQLHKIKQYREIENGTKTSIGFLLPKKDSVKYAAKIIICESL